MLRQGHHKAERPLVSVVIATYNMAKYLPLAIRSALAQTYEAVEVLVVDDGSQDDTIEIMASFQDDGRVKYVSQRNLGQASAKNRGVREARGQYIAFLDADDLWVADKLEKQMPFFSKSTAVGVVYARHVYMDEAGEDVKMFDEPLFRGRISGPLLISNFVGFGTSVVKRECFERLGGFDESIRMGIDYDLWLRFSTRYEFDYVDEPLLRYRVWDGQMSKNCKARYISGIAIMERFLASFPALVDKRITDEAWAHTYVGYGECLRSVDGGIRPALALFIRALRYRPTYRAAWRSVVGLLLKV